MVARKKKAKTTLSSQAVIKDLKHITKGNRFWRDFEKTLNSLVREAVKVDSSQVKTILHNRRNLSVLKRISNSQVSWVRLDNDVQRILEMLPEYLTARNDDIEDFFYDKNHSTLLSLMKKLKTPD